MRTPTHAPADAPRTIIVLLLARTALNLQFRVVYPFLPAIGRGLGVPLETASLLLTARAVVSVASPLFGALADRLGRRALMLAGLVALVLAALIMTLGSGPGPLGFGLALVAFALFGFSKSSFDPAMQAYVGDAVPYARRGRVMGLLELPWSLAWFIGVPLCGVLIARFGWRSPFWLIALAGTAGLLALWRLCPACGIAQPTGDRAAAPTGVPWRAILRISLPVLLVSLLLVMAMENVFIVYGAWLEGEFGLAVSTIGAVSIVISLAEMLAEGLSAGLVDRLGKRRAVLGGFILLLLALLLLPRLSGTLATALGGMALFICTFEFAIVSLVPLVSEIVPSARGSVLALNVAAMSVGRIIATLTAPRLWAAGGLPANALASAAMLAVGIVVLWRVVREK